MLKTVFQIINKQPTITRQKKEIHIVHYDCVCNGCFKLKIYSKPVLNFSCTYYWYLELVRSTATHFWTSEFFYSIFVDLMIKYLQLIFFII
jgi:hypothetical protein